MKLNNFKLKNRRRTKIIIGSLVGLMLFLGGFLFNKTLGKYQVSQSFPVMEGKIQVNSGDVSIIAVNVDGVKKDVVPSKSEGYRFEKAECTNNAVGSWDRSNWRFLLSTSGKTKCTLSFVKGSSTGEQSGESKLEDLLQQQENQVSKATIASDSNNIRYIGQNPSNYVYFNCKSGNSAANQCEVWRIIGLMDGIQTSAGKTERLLKIIRKDKLSVNLSWDSSASGVNNGYGVNEWSQADLQNELNNETNGYLNTVKQTGSACFTGSNESKGECPDWSTEGITATAKNMIETVVWNTGTAYTTSWSSSNVTPLQYMWERSNNNGRLGCSSSTGNCSDTVPRKTTWTGKVGLMYPSDYGYATDGGGSQTQRDTCIYTPLYNWDNNSNCKNNDWLYDSSNYQWTMTPAPRSSYAYYVFTVHTSGNVNYNDAYGANAVRPVVYLKSNVKISGGDGSSGNPYTLTIS